MNLVGNGYDKNKLIEALRKALVDINLINGNISSATGNMECYYDDFPCNLVSLAENLNKKLNSLDRELSLTIKQVK